MAQRVNLTFISSLILCSIIHWGNSLDHKSTPNYQHGHDPHLCSQSLWLICHEILTSSSRRKNSGRSALRSLYNKKDPWFMDRKIVTLTPPWYIWLWTIFRWVHSQPQSTYNLCPEKFSILFSTLFVSSSGKRFWNLTHKVLKIFSVNHDTSYICFPFPHN